MMIRGPEILALAKTRLLHLLREPEAVFWTFVFPVMLSVVLGLAFKDRKASQARAGVLAGAGAAWLEALRAQEAVEVVLLESREEAERLMRSGALSVVVDAGPPVTLRYDPTRPEAGAARVQVEDALQRAAGREDPLEIRMQEESGTGARYVDWLIPGLLGLSLMSTGIWSIGYGVVEFRQKKLLKRFLVTPMAKTSFLLSFVLARLVFVVLEVGVILAFALLVLHVPLRGNPLSLAVLCLVGALCFSGLAVLIGSRARTPEGVGGLIYLAFMPMGLGSGVFFSYENFADPLIPVVKALPLTALNDALRATMLEGEGLVSLWPNLAIQGAWGLVTFLIGLKLFRWN